MKKERTKTAAAAALAKVNERKMLWRTQREKAGVTGACPLLKKSKPNPDTLETPDAAPANLPSLTPLVPNAPADPFSSAYKNVIEPTKDGESMNEQKSDEPVEETPQAENQTDPAEQPEAEQKDGEEIDFTQNPTGDGNNSKYCFASPRGFGAKPQPKAREPVRVEARKLS